MAAKPREPVGGEGDLRPEVVTHLRDGKRIDHRDPKSMKPLAVERVVEVEKDSLCETVSETELVVLEEWLTAWLSVTPCEALWPWERVVDCEVESATEAP